MKSVLLLFLFLFLASIILDSLADSVPGCSFVKDKCIYTVQMDHEKRCHQSELMTQTSATASCCNKATVSVKKMDILEQVDVFKRAKTTTPPLCISNKVLLEKVTKENRDLRTNLQLCQAALKEEDSVPPKDAAFFFCSFDTDSCSFDITSDSIVDVGLKSFFSMEGPSVDHTMGTRTGRFLGLDAWTTANARLATKGSDVVKTGTATSKIFQPASDYCIFFWYFMSGKDTKDLTLDLMINGGTGYPVFKKSGPQSDRWELAQISLNAEYTSRQFQIMFKFTTTAHWYKVKRNSWDSDYQRYPYIIHRSNDVGNIAIDDVYVYDTKCSNLPKFPPSSYTDVFKGINSTSHYTFHTEPLTWKDAYNKCRQEGPWSALISIESKKEQSFTVNAIQKDKTLIRAGMNGFYTSGTDKDNKHNFTWTDTGIPKTVPDGFWHKDQPNNVGGRQDCLLLQYPSDNFRWGDVDCTSKHPFICEATIPTSTSS